jgi:uncharacterized protein (DUF2225 family)
MRKSLTILGLLVVLSMSASVIATTWGSKEIKCSLCGKESEMEVIASYGSYIYRWPSKYQLVFWPRTTARFVYFCKHCHLAAFMGDFQDIPKDKQAAVKKAIAPLIKKQPDKRYYEIPMDYRLEISQAVYEQLDKDDEFWCNFYRVKGYHLAKAGQAEQAKAARLKAQAIAEKMLAAELDRPPKKEQILIIGSMQYFSGQKDKALTTLAKVAKTPIPISKSTSAEQAKNATTYLDKLAADFIELVKAGKKVPE